MHIWPLVVVVAVPAVWIVYANRPAVVRVPDAPDIPSPNAYDTYLEAARLADFGDEPVPEPEDLSADQKARLLECFAPALAKLREGLALAREIPPVSSCRDGDFPLFCNLRNLARLLSVEASLKAERGDPAGAISSTLDAVQLGADIGRNGTLIEYLVGVAIEAIGTNRAFGFVGRLGSAEARDAAGRVCRVIAALPKPEAVVRQEQRLCADCIRKLLPRWNWRWVLVHNWFAGMVRPMFWWYVLSLMRSLLLTRRGVVRDFETAWNDLITRLSVSYRESAGMPEVRTNWLTEMMVAVTPRVGLISAERRLRLAFLACAFALHAWNVERGEYPVSLAELLPDYLQSVPVDPFGCGEPLRYRRTEQGYILYSVGPDGVDDGGRHFQDRKPGANLVQCWKARPDSKGDITLESADLSRVS